MKSKILRLILLGWILGGLAIYFYLPALQARLILTPFHRPFWISRVWRGADDPADLDLPFERIAVVTPDGAVLRGWLILPDRAHLTVYYLHGHGDNRTQGLPRARWLYRHRYGFLLMDLRAHGRSTGEVCTYGLLEKQDVRQIIDELEKTHGIRRWVLWGTSLGAAIALQAGEVHPDIRGVVAEAPFARLERVLERHVRFFYLGIGFPFRKETFTRIEARLGFPLPYDEPLSSAEKLDLPLLLVHGANDRRIPPQNSRLLLVATQPHSKLLLIDQANHFNCWKKGGERYRRELLEFLERIE